MMLGTRSLFTPSRPSPGKFRASAVVEPVASMRLLEPGANEAGAAAFYLFQWSWKFQRVGYCHAQIL